jgi:energy-coupling factor transporter transmembrane protein EcfT
LRRRFASRFVIVVAAEIVYYLTRGGWRSIIAALVLSGVTVFFVYKRDSSRRLTDSGSIAALIVGVCAWMSAGSLVSWTDATGWYLTNPVRAIVIAICLAISIYAVRAFSPTTDDTRTPGLTSLLARSV